MGLSAQPGQPSSPVQQQRLNLAQTQSTLRALPVKVTEAIRRHIREEHARQNKGHRHKGDDEDVAMDEDKIRDAFVHFDHDKSSTISLEELHKVDA